MNKNTLLDDFFASGKEESISPFYTSNSKKWAYQLPIRISLFSAISLLMAYLFSYLSEPLSAVCLLSVYFISGTPALINSLHELKKKEINIDILMTLAALLSVVIGSGMEGGLLLVLFEISGSMEEMVSTKTRSALISLNKISPRTAFVVMPNNALIERSTREIQVGDHILVKAGEMIPLDGIVIEGRSYVNTVHLTGENAPIAKKIGDEVPAGATNLDGTLTLNITKTSADSTLTRIITLITEAQESKPKVQRLFDRFEKWYASSVILISFTSIFVLHLCYALPYLGPEGSIYRALAFLIAASPCALIIALPTAYLSAISSCAKRGILLKGGTILDAIASTSIIAFDKTGTLTTGQLKWHAFSHLSGPKIDFNQVLAYAATLEKHAVHPMAEAITNFAMKNGLNDYEVEDFQAVAGWGLHGRINNQQVWIGHKEFIQSKLQEAVAFEPAESLVTYLLIEKSLFAFYFTDTIRTLALSSLKTLRQQKLETIMLTGDCSSNALPVAKTLGITKFFADLRPEDKLRYVEELSQSKGLIMVGDGINDGPALARATVGISMGKIGSATAVEASDVVFLHDDLSQLPWLHQKSQSTLRIVRQNLILALTVICFTTTPALIGFIPLWLAVILHEGGTVLVGLNSLRLLRQKA